MADAFTGNYSFTQPEVGSSTDTWGGKLNTNWGNLDTFLNQFVGMMAMFSATGAIDGWLKCNGQTVSRTTYERLWNHANVTGRVAASEGAKLPGEFGPGDGSTDFSLPDVRGYHLRCYDDGAGVDSSRTFGDVQADQNLDHNHTGTTGTAGDHSHTASTNSAGSHSHSGSTSTDGLHTHGRPTWDASVTDTSGNTNPQRVKHASNTTGFFASGPTGWDLPNNGNHNHSLSINSNGAHSHSVTVDSVSGHTHTFGTTNNGGSEVRVKNIALTMYIRY